jgi:hypothetical protein
MSNIGIYRYKIASVFENGNTVIFQVGGTDIKTCTILPQKLCDGKRILKYLNRDGQYRFYAFSNYYEEVDKPKEIGTVNKIITSILNSKSGSKSIGIKSDRAINIKSESIPTSELEMLRDIYNSPRVYLYIGSGTDTENDWLLVSIKANKSIRKEPKAKFSQIDIEVTLPETYSITML